MKLREWIHKKASQPREEKELLQKLKEHDERTATEQRRIRESLARIEEEVRLLSRDDN